VSGTHYRSDIQGLRAIAVLAVMVFHYNPTWLPGGFIGVDVFLVISGFLITSILLKKKAQPGYTLSATFKYFYSSRLKRIAPAYFFMLVLVAFAGAVFFIPKDFNIFKDGLEKAAWFTSNDYFAGFGDYFAPANHEQPLLHTWSLAVEIQFYLLAPLLILLLPIKTLKYTLVALLVGCTLLAEYRLRFLGIEQATYYSLYARLPEFFAGCLAALFVTSTTWRERGRITQWLSSSGLLVILLAAIAQPKLGHFPGLPALLPIMGTVFLLIGTSKGLTARLLSNRALVWIGALSYSLYLWHWPVLAFLRYYTGSEVLDLSFSLLFIALTFLLSMVSYYWLERPFRTEHVHKRQALNWFLLTTAVLGTSQVMANVNEAFTPEQLPIEYQRYADPAGICHGKIVSDCLQGDLSSDREVLVLGDSHAAMLNNFFAYLGKELGFKARIITASSCVTIPDFDYKRIAEWAHQQCQDQIKIANEHLAKAKIVFLAALWNWQLKSKDFESALVEFFQTITSNGTHVYIIGQEPLLNSNPLRVLRFNNLGLVVESQRNPDYVRTNRLLRKFAEEIPKLDYLGFDNLPIFEKAPIYQGEPVYYDNNHINEIGIIEYAKQAKSVIKNSIFNNKYSHPKGRLH